jgi:hypothetical protein
VEDVSQHAKHVNKSNNPAKVLVLGVVSSDGQKFPKIFRTLIKRVITEIYIIF